MKIKYEIERKIEGDNGKKSEKETTITFDDLPDVKKAVKKVGAFFAKKAKEVAELATDVVAEVTYNVASTAANALDSVADTADTVVNSIDRFLDENFEVVEEEVEEDICDGQCCGNCCCGETCEDDLADVIDDIINELEDEDDEADEDGVEDDAESDRAEETSEDDSSDVPEEDPLEAFLKGVFSDVEKVSTEVVAFIKADDAEKAETIKKVEEYVGNIGGKIANHFGILIKKSEKTSEEEETAEEDEIEKVSVDSSNADEPAEEVAPEKSIEEKLAAIPEGTKYSLREFLDYLGIYDCNKKAPDVVKEACIFFAVVKYPATMYTRKAFENAITLDKVTYENVVKSIKDYFPDDSDDQILDHLHDEFDEWVTTTNIKKYCPNLNFRYLLMYFVSKVRGCN